MYPVSDFSSNRHVDLSNRLTSSCHLGTASMDWVVVSSCMAPSFCPSCCWHHHFQSSEYSANNLENLLFFTWPWMTSATSSWLVEVSGSITSHMGCIKSEGPTSSKSQPKQWMEASGPQSCWPLLSMSGKEYRQLRLLALHISLAKPSMYPGSDFSSNRNVDYSNRLTSSGHLGIASMDWVVVSSCMAPSFWPSCCWHHHFQSPEYSANNLENLLFFNWPWMTPATSSWSVEVSGSITSHMGCIKSEGPTSSKSQPQQWMEASDPQSCWSLSSIQCQGKNTDN